MLSTSLLLLRVDLSSLSSRKVDVDDGRTSNDVVIGDRVTNARDNRVNPAVTNSLRNSDRVTIANLGVVNLETSEESSVLTRLNAVTVDGNLLTTANVTRDGGGGESLNGKSGVRGRAAGDEGSCERVGLVEVERSAEITRESVTELDGGLDPGCWSETKSEQKDGGGEEG